MILISGIGQGSDDKIQEQLAVGVGTLAGSTIMLITMYDLRLVRCNYPVLTA